MTSGYESAVPVEGSVKRGEEMNRKSIAMNVQEREALAALVTYCWDDELADYEEREPEDRPGHVYGHLLTLARYLESTVTSTDEACAHSWVADMVYVHDEDLDAVARMRRVECERCEAVYMSGGAS